MSLSHILAFLILAVVIGSRLQGRFRLWSMYVLSLLAAYILQPLVPLRFFDYWFPTFSIILTAGIWFVLGNPERRLSREDTTAGLLAIFAILIVGLIRFVPFDIPWFPASTPSLVSILLLLAIFVLLFGFFTIRARMRQIGLWVSLLVLIGLFIVIKTEALSVFSSEHIRQMLGQSVSLASPSDLNWLGFSYISFRLIHVIRDHRSGRLPATSLREFMTYVLFFPALVAGPIDRIERFVEDLRSNERLSGSQAVEAGRRILLGAFKKFVVADGLALLALNSTNAALSNSIGWTWVLLYGYGLRLYFDFSGYTDVALGLGLLTGIELPENFDQPYLKTNMTAFWNSWHMTLARWFRAYFFNPLTRWLRKGLLSSSPGLIILFGQLSTMLLIGLWHGVTWNFAIWGLWHGVGLFIHNRWNNFLRSPSRPKVIDNLPEHVTQVLGFILTFQFTTVGWVWFALPELSLSLRVLRTLFGFTG